MRASGLRVITVVGSVGVVGGFVATLLLGLSTPASAAPAESITSYDARFEVRADGTLSVRETIGYDFGTARRHGMVRDIPVRLRYDDAHDRLYPIENVTASVDGSPVPVRQSAAGNDEVLQIGDPDVTVTGAHTYVIGYTVRAALNGSADHVELSWNLIGDQWHVPIAAATAVVTGPAPIQGVTCFAGTITAKQACVDSSVDGRTASFHQPDLGNGSGLTAVITFPPGSVSDVRPILVPHRDAATRLGVTAGMAAATLGLALAAVVAVLLAAWWIGRDASAPVDLGPPDGVPPGLLGALRHGRVRAVDITATIVDLAVRGHLAIREVPRPSRPGKSDWELTRLDTRGASFRRYEGTLFDALFRTSERIRLSQLDASYATELLKARGEVYTDMVVRGWYRRRPDRVRLAARLTGASVLVVSMAVTAALAVTVPAAAPLGAALLPAGLVLLAVAGWFPARTAVGSAVLTRADSLHRHLASMRTDHLAVRAQERTFSRYLPFALVFGIGDVWADAFANLGGESADRLRLSWYDGSFGCTASQLGRSFDEFARPRVITRFARRRPVGSGVGGSSGSGYYTGAYSDGGGWSGGGGYSGDAGGGGGGGSW